MDISFQNLETTEPIGKVWKLNPSQVRFWESKKKVVLFSGGFGCGKSVMLILKAIELALKYPDNFILMGRKTYVELRDSLLKEFFVICPPELIESFQKSELKIKMVNGSEIIFRHLDKMAENEIRSLNLGQAFIDQAEDISKEVFLALVGRLRREGIDEFDRKIYMSINPELTWHYADFKQNPKPEYELIEASTYENRSNLPEGYIENMEANYPEDFRLQYMEGKWDESLLSKNAVFEREFIEALERSVREYSHTTEGLLVYKEFIPGHRYQMGIDVAEGSEEETDKKDKSSIVIVDLTDLEEVAHWSGQLPPDVVGEKAIQYARLYQNDRTQHCLIVPEMNSIGWALLDVLKKPDDIEIYRREEFDKATGRRTKQLGWRTGRSSKQLLVSHFKELLRKRDPQVRTKETVAEFRTFVYSNEARKSGMGAKGGSTFHDDRLMATLLAFFEEGEVTPGTVLHRDKNGAIINSINVVPTLIIKDGKAHLKGLEPINETNSWKTH